MAGNGFIKLYRSVLDNPVVCKDADHLAVWIYLLCEATHKDRSVVFNGEKIALTPGQLTTGRRRISEKLKISESKTQRILASFKKENQIEQRTDRQCRLISIVNWSEYQCAEQQNEQRPNNGRTTGGQRVNTKQEGENEKNERMKEKNKQLWINAGADMELLDALVDFEEMRNVNKKIMTDRARKMLITKLSKLSDGKTDLSIRIIEQSINRCWTDVFPLKKDNSVAAAFESAISRQDLCEFE